jgi:hypothetical protein
MPSPEPSNSEMLMQIHDQVAVYVKQLDAFTRGLSTDQALELANEARHLFTVVTFLRDATVDLLESAGVDVDAGNLDPLSGPPQQ